MKYGTITFHRAVNFGAVLQTLALQEALKKTGIDSEVIDYRCQFIERHYAPFRITDVFNLRRVYGIVKANAFSRNNRSKFDEFIRKYIKTSSCIYNTKNDLLDSNSAYDAFIAGSDQVWSYFCAGFDKAYFLDFVLDKRKKMSYAASFGVDSIPEEYIQNYEMLLKDFHRISVREEQGKQILQDILHVDVPIVLDPTLLLTRAEWGNYMNPVKHKGEYILVYLMTETEEILSFARKLSARTKYKIIYINDRFYKRYGMTNVDTLSPSDWLTLVLNAKYMITNSYHGVAFSINFNIDFFVEFLAEPAKVNSRLKNILDIFDLKERLISNMHKESVLTKIDYALVNKKLEIERNSSMQYINGLKRQVEN